MRREAVLALVGLVVALLLVSPTAAQAAATRIMPG